jgi:hypothetical protein
MPFPQLALTRRNRQRLAAGIPRIDWTNPLTRGLVSCYLPGQGFFDICGVGPRLTLTSTFSYGNSVEGLAFGSATAAAGAVGSVPPALQATTRLTFYWRGVMASATLTNAEIMVLSYNNSWTAPFGITLRANTSNLFLGWNNNGSFSSITLATTWATNVVTSVAFTLRTGGSAIGYKNGVSLGSSSAGTGPITYAASPKLCFNNNPAFSGNSNCYALMGLVWNRDLSAREIQALDRDPYQFLIFPEDILSARLVGRSGALWARAAFFSGARLGPLTGAAALSGVVKASGATAGAPRFLANLLGNASAASAGRFASSLAALLAAWAMGGAKGALGPASGKASLLGSATASGAARASPAVTAALSSVARAQGQGRLSPPGMAAILLTGLSRAMGAAGRAVMLLRFSVSGQVLGNSTKRSRALANIATRLRVIVNTVKRQWRSP